jgi:hypothetical protein
MAHFLSRNSNRNASRRPTRLKLEALEDRVAPAVINVTSLADLANPPAGIVTLRSAIQTANTNADASNTINLTVPGTYALSAGELAITASKGLTIQNTSGGTVIVDGGGLNRVFDVNPAAQNTTPFTVTFAGLTIQDGVAAPGDGDVGSGGGIRAQGAASIVLNGVALINNTATADGGGIALESIGNVGIGTLTITGSFIANNHAGDAGGGVESDGNGMVTINSSTIQDNTCINQGAGVWLDAGTANLLMNGDVVKGNVAITMLGGGIGNAGSGSVTLVGCAIENNVSGGTGGGFADAANTGNLTVDNCLFLDNTAVGNGGGIQEGGPQTTITNSVFDGNVSAGNGGGVFGNGGGLILKNNVFRRNVAVNGGGVEADSNAFQGTNCTFDTNHAQGSNGDNGNTAGPGGSGGAVEFQSNGTNTPNDLLANSLFIGNVANNGPNGNGGAIADLAGNLEVSNCQLTGNVSGNSGGAIFASGNSLFVFGSTLNNNRAPGSGGAISLSTTAASTVELSTLVGNSAGVNGGGIFDSAGALSVLADTINANSTGNIGGGISIFNGGSLTIGDTIVFGNTTGFGAPDVFSLTITDRGGNLIGVAPPGFGAGTLIGVDPKLGLLMNNGGQRAGAFSNQQVVQTEALLPGSPAIGKGVNGLAEVQLDERFFASPASGRANVSIGAYEPQFASTATPNQVFVENLYEVLLNRPTDPGSVFFTRELDGGVSPTTVVLQIESSQEYRSDQVNLLYQRYLHRNADQGGLQGFVNFLGNGGTMEQVAAFLVGSQEYFDDRGGNNETFLNSLYEEALDRQADRQGLVGFEQTLANGTSRTQVASLIFSSPEYLTDLVQSGYQSALGRKADASGLNFFVNEAQHGASDQLVVAQLLGSGESFAKRS